MKELRSAISNFHLKGPVMFDMLRKTILGDRVKPTIKRPHSATMHAAPQNIPKPMMNQQTMVAMNVGPNNMTQAMINKDEFDKFIANEILKEKAKSEEANRLLALMDSATFQSLPHDKRQRIEIKYWSIIGL